MVSAQNPFGGKTLSGVITDLRAKLSAYRVPIFVFALALFLGGTIYSAMQLNVRLADLQWAPIAFLAFVLLPISFIYGAVNFIIMGRGAGVSVSFASSLKTACIAQFAEFLPLPGGAIVRTGALVAKGSRVGGAAKHVAANALLWVACAAIAAGISIGATSTEGLIFVTTGICGTLVCTVWLAKSAGWSIAFAALALRCIGLVIAGMRLLCAFMAIAVPMTLMDAYPFAFAAILGSASALAPGGLGIGEALAALIASLSTVVPTAAFLAVGLNRLVGLCVSGAATGAISLINSTTEPTSETAEP